MCSSDLINGGIGNDVLNGGSGADTFVFTNFGSSNFDTIQDFLTGTDKIQISAAAINSLIGRSASWGSFIIGNHNVNNDAFDHIMFDNSNPLAKTLWFDQGNSTNQYQIATFSTTFGVTNPNVVSADILIV